MRNVILHGHLAEKFGPSFRLAVATAGEALRALNVNFPGQFVEALMEGSYRVVRGEDFDLELEVINEFNLGMADLHIVPVIAGSASGNKGGSAVKTIIGVALVGVAIFASGGTLAAPLAGMGATAFGGVTWGTIALFGVAMALSGIAGMLTPKDANKPKTDSQKQDSFSFSGPVNVTGAGGAVPLIYGHVITGSVVISAGFDVEDIPVAG